jgi:hypothetical protein
MSCRGHRENFSSGQDWIPKQPTLERLREAATDCKACDLHKSGTQKPYLENAMATVHPSSILRAESDEARHEAEQLFVRISRCCPGDRRGVGFLLTTVGRSSEGSAAALQPSGGPAREHGKRATSQPTQKFSALSLSLES